MDKSLCCVNRLDYKGNKLTIYKSIYYDKDLQQQWRKRSPGTVRAFFLEPYHN